jgi:hypothetical protein
MYASARTFEDAATGLVPLQPVGPEPRLFVEVTGTEPQLTVQVTHADSTTPGTATAAAFFPGQEARSWKVCSTEGSAVTSHTEFAYVEAPFSGADLVIVTTAITEPNSQEKGSQP